MFFFNFDPGLLGNVFIARLSLVSRVEQSIRDAAHRRNYDYDVVTILLTGL